MKTRSKWLLMVLAGLIYGLYFSLGFSYFETFLFPLEKTLQYHLLVFPILFLQGTLITFIYLRQKAGVFKAFHILRLSAMMLSVLLLTGGLLFLLGGITTTQGFGLNLLKKLTGDHLLLCMLPLVVALVLWQQRSVKVALHLKVPLPQNQDAEHTPAPMPIEKPTPMLSIDAGGEGQTLDVALADLLLVEAADNYCKFYFLSEGKRKIKTLRMKLKAVEEALQGSTDFFRVHRSFIVNRLMVEEVQGPSQSHKLKLNHHEELIPVSRSFDVQSLKVKNR